MRNYFNSFFNFFEFDGRPSTDFGVMVFSRGEYSDPEPNETEIEIPGMNGTLHFWDGTFSNVTVTYSVMVKGDDALIVREKVERMRAWLLSKRKYCILQDTFHPDHYRMGIYKGKSDVEYSANEKMGKLNIKFDCKPQNFLKSGDIPIIFTANGSIFNQYEFESRPLIRCYGTGGAISVGGSWMGVSECTSYVDIDCESMEAYEGSINRNANVGGEFPTLKPGSNSVGFLGFSRIEVYPRWWTL